MPDIRNIINVGSSHHTKLPSETEQLGEIYPKIWAVALSSLEWD